MSLRKRSDGLLLKGGDGTLLNNCSDCHACAQCCQCCYSDESTVTVGFTLNQTGWPNECDPDDPDTACDDADWTKTTSSVVCTKIPGSGSLEWVYNWGDPDLEPSVHVYKYCDDPDAYPYGYWEIQYRTGTVLCLARIIVPGTSCCGGSGTALAIVYDCDTVDTGTATTNVTLSVDNNHCCFCGKCRYGANEYCASGVDAGACDADDANLNYDRCCNDCHAYVRCDDENETAFFTKPASGTWPDFIQWDGHCWEFDNDADPEHGCDEFVAGPTVQDYRDVDLDCLTTYEDCTECEAAL